MQRRIVRLPIWLLQESVDLHIREGRLTFGGWGAICVLESADAETWARAAKLTRRMVIFAIRRSALRRISSVADGGDRAKHWQQAASGTESWRGEGASHAGVVSEMDESGARRRNRGM